MTNGDELRVLNRTGYFIVITPLNTTAFGKKRRRFSPVIQLKKIAFVPTNLFYEIFMRKSKIRKMVYRYCPIKKNSKL